jgi:hypothetical protein
MPAPRVMKDMSEQARTITREELYENLWKTPITKLAKAWGLPYVALIKACEDLNVPRPEPGHWQQVQRGHQPEPPALPTRGAITLIHHPLRQFWAVTQPPLPPQNNWPETLGNYSL